jgi:hypothetical protein
MKMTALRLVANLNLFLFMGIELLYLYHNNLSLIYQGTGTIVACYAVTLVLTSAGLNEFVAGGKAT